MPLVFKPDLDGSTEWLLRCAVDEAYIQLRDNVRADNLAMATTRVSEGGGYQTSKTDHRFEAILIGVLHVLRSMEIKLDMTTLPEDLSKLDVETLDRIMLAIGVELDRRGRPMV